MKKFMGVMAVAMFGVAAGCGSSDNTCGDGGCLDSSTFSDTATVADGPMPWSLTRGTNMYKITGISRVTDGCMFNPAMVVSDPISVTYDDATQKVTIGKATGTPATPFFGSGTVAATTINTATLMRENDVGNPAPSTCTWHEKVVSTFQLYANDKFTLTPELTDSNFATSCTATEKPPGATCMSTWTWTIEKP